MRERIISKLITELQYSLAVAEGTAAVLENLKDEDLRQGLLEWLQTDATPYISQDTYSTANLMFLYDMSYPAALIFIDWYRENPTVAADSLTVRM